MLTAAAPWGHVQRPWGYEVRVDFTGPDGAVYNEVLTFRSAPSTEKIAEAVATRASAVETRLATTVPVAGPEIALREQVEMLTRQVAAFTVENLRLVKLLTPVVIVR